MRRHGYHLPVGALLMDLARTQQKEFGLRGFAFVTPSP